MEYNLHDVAIWQAKNTKRKAENDLQCFSDPAHFWSDVKPPAVVHMLHKYQLDTSGCFTQMPDCVRMFVQSVVLLTLTGDCHCSCPCMEYDTTGKEKQHWDRELWTASWSMEGSCAINRHRVNIWSSTALAVACIRVSCTCMWEPLKEDGVHVECVSNWVSWLCELTTGKNQDRHFCPRPPMACLISFISEPYSLLLCVSNHECIHVRAQSVTFLLFFFHVNSLRPTRVYVCMLVLLLLLYNLMKCLSDVCSFPVESAYTFCMSHPG